MSGLSRRCQEAGYGLLFGDAYSNDPVNRAAQAKALAEDFARKRVSGVIFQPAALIGDMQTVNGEIVSIFDSAGIPVVLVDNDIVPPPERSEYDLVGINNFEAGRLLGGHLLDVGARRICFLVHNRCSASVSLRSSGVMAAVGGRRGVKFSTLCTEPDETAAIRKFLAKEKPDAIVCGNDKTAAHLRQTLAHIGKRVPEDVMLAGFDDVQIASVMTPQLTTIRQPCDGIAEAAFAALLERMRNPSLHPREILLPAPLIIRESTRG
jgi:DNA-binding LacI/PurR family transcriptional regulator